MDPAVEIRKLPMSARSVLIKLLELQESWKKLMAIIPQTLSIESYKCDISLNNPAKYRSEDFHTIENAAERKRIYCAEILLREWGTSGRVRPALGHLKYLLEKAQLFRTADYVTENILKQERPRRPNQGPAAPIVFNSDELEDSETKRIEKILDEIDYPSSAIANITNMNSVNTNLNYTTKDVKTIPKIIFSEYPDSDESKPRFKVPLVVPVAKVKTESDMIKFSTNSVSDSDNANVPRISSLLTAESTENTQSSETTTSELSSDNLPAVINNSTESISFDANRPDLSGLLSMSGGSPQNNFNIPALSDLTLSSSGSEPSSNIPALSGLSLSSSASSSSSASNVPALSQLLTESDSKGTSSKNCRSCSSPLPNLSLNTPLPHFSYIELEVATHNFDETPLSQGGRFLGSGAFGKVYLAENLLDKLVAVKKVLLDNAEVVQVDDLVTRQFRNEVEILNKYNHENLVSLLGYSCDGLTYCLVYEYVPGGALKDRLPKHDLIWTVRLYIALGTARAISYLHNADSTPSIHRDVKSANILLDRTDKPKLCDFGLIKQLLNQNTNTATTIFGTAAYMASEAFRGDISVKLDTFSFGVVLLELLTSLPPTDDNRDGHDLVTHVQEKCPNEITPLLDNSAGSWSANGINFGQKIYEIAKNCLKEKQQRPLMTTVCAALSDLIQKSL